MNETDVGELIDAEGHAWSAQAHGKPLENEYEAPTHGVRLSRRGHGSIRYSILTPEQAEALAEQLKDAAREATQAKEEQS